VFSASNVELALHLTQREMGLSSASLTSQVP
jgi:hypothetical protein